MLSRPVAWFLCLGCLILPCRAMAQEEGLLGYWKFDQRQGDVAVDSSGNQNDGEIWDAEWVEGGFGTALWFGGQGAHVSIPQIDGLDGSDELTVSAWVYWEGTGRYPNIVSGGTWSPGGFLMFVVDDQCTFRMGRPGVSASLNKKEWRETSAPLLTPFAQRRWYHLAATFKRPAIKTYVNGKQVGSASWDYPVAHQGDLVIGKWSGATSHEGLIDEVKIFDRALGEDEIAASYSQQAGRRKPTAKGPTEGPIQYKPIPRDAQLAEAVATFENKFAKLAVSSLGRCVSLIDKSTGQDYIRRTSPLVWIKRENKLYRRAKCSLQDGGLVFRFAEAETTVRLGVTVNPEYFVFQVESVDGPGPDELTFVQLNVKCRDQVNTMSGLAADDRFGVCLRTLNLETHVSVGGNPPLLVARAFAEHGLEGGQAALAACPRERLRKVLQDVVRDEDLPYSPLGGPFARDAQENRGAYVFANVSHRNVEDWIALARRGGIQTIHLSGWQKSLGHYEPRQDLFPGGLKGMKAVVDKLHAAGLKVGIHTLTGCVGTNDEWVRPVPDRRLATDGTFTLTADLDEKDTDVPIAEPPGHYPTVWAYSSRGNCLRIDDELIQYAVISRDTANGFFQCKRGAFGTRVAPHKKGAEVHHLIARYGSFIPDEKSTLVDEVAQRIADVFNACELDQIYMDGAEAMRGWYGIARMRREIFTRLDGPVLVEASCWDHHSWPFHSRVGAWDHPKWGLKRFADDHFRAIGQYRDGALLEAQLGWWVILGASRDWNMEMPDEIEYLLGKALGYDAPLSFQSVSATGRPANARQDEFFTMIGNYERLRLADYFGPAVKQQLRQERQEFRLGQADDGRWGFTPTDYSRHKVTAIDNGSNLWTAINRFGRQPVKLRIEALYSAYPFDDEGSLALTDASADREFVARGSAAGVRASYQSGARNVPQGRTVAARFSGLNEGDAPVGAWTRVEKILDPVVNLTPHDALGVWVHGDGRGQLLNLQLTNLPEYFRTIDDHYIKVDFRGWRYFELLMRERDAAAYHDYQWPYGAHCVLHRSPLVRPVVSKLTLYLNNLPPQNEAVCYLSPVKALRTRKVVLHNPAVTVGEKKLLFPVDLQSGMYLEFESADDCRLYDERGNLLKWVKPSGDVPSLTPGENSLAFDCQGTDGFRSRAEVTVITQGTPLGNDAAPDTVDWSLLEREYQPPRTICAIDGRQNRWSVSCRPEAKQAELEFQIDVDQVGTQTEAYDAPTALTLEHFEKPDSSTGQTKHRADHVPLAQYAYDSERQTSGCKAGVTQMLLRSSEIVKFGNTSARYTATSTLDDNTGWSIKGKRFKAPLDLSGFAAIGFWLHGDSAGQQFKLQLHDAEGGWQDMYTTVNFSGWRYCQFNLGGPRLKNLAKIVAMNVYYNGIPAGKTVTCHVDEIRAVSSPQPLRQLQLAVGGQSVRFPVAINAGDQLVFAGMENCRLIRQSGTVEKVKPQGTIPRLVAGPNEVVFSLPDSSTREFRVLVLLEKKYPQ